MEVPVFVCMCDSIYGSVFDRDREGGVCVSERVREREILLIVS